MADGDSARAYHGRRRASLPAMKLQQPLVPHLNISLSSPRRKQSIELETASQKPAKHDELKPATPRRSSLKGSLSPTRQPSPRNTKTNHKITYKLPQNSPPSSPRKDALPAGYNRGRRHSVDVLVTSQSKSMTSPQHDTHKAWAAFCRVSDPKNFDADVYEKDCPHGTSLFRSVLADLKESASEDEDDVTPARAQKKSQGTSSNSSTDEDYSNGKRRLKSVRFRSNSAEDG